MRLTETSGRTVAQVAAGPGIGKSTLTRWKNQFRAPCLKYETARRSKL
ncbi:hypothetical protein D3877_28505 [Azospirillum cavernae]|uniref:Transposase n=1 Tax=Azospirillum cavernae TaxID=2320860 RepID=A0A418VL00_9PROT|nr:hypothetical protein D3877_28505 [Azospirillum cavernae]